MFNIQEFQASFSPLYFTVSKCILHGKSANSVLLHCTECALNNGYFIQRYRSDPSTYSSLPSAKIQPDSLFSIYKSFKLLFQHYIVL